MLWVQGSHHRTLWKLLFFHGPLRNTELEVQSHLAYWDLEERLELGSQFRFRHAKFCLIAWGWGVSKGGQAPEKAMKSLERKSPGT